jgi:hypothetical protein
MQAKPASAANSEALDGALVMRIGPVVGFVLLEPIAVALALWDIAHGRFPRHPFQRRDAALLALRERSRRYVAEHEETQDRDATG